MATTALERALRQGLAVAAIPPWARNPSSSSSPFLPSRAFRRIPFAGWDSSGCLLLYMAWRVLRDVGHAEPREQAEQAKGHFARVAFMGVISPDPWIFWFIVGGPLFLNRWNVSPVQGVAFAASFILPYDRHGDLDP